LKAVVPVISCHPTETIIHLIEKLSVLKIHRLYIVDEHHKPIGVISLGDLLSKIVELQA